MPKAQPIRKSTRTAAKRPLKDKAYADPLTTTRPSWRERKSTRKNLEPTKIKTTPAQRKSKKSTPSYLFRSPVQMKTDTNRQVPLFSLPPEIMRKIAKYCTVSTEICLSLTCKEAATIIGTQSWFVFTHTNPWALDNQLVSDRATLFDSLLRDLHSSNNDHEKGFHYCDVCGILHPPLKPPRTHRKTSWTTACLGVDAMIDHLPSSSTAGYMPVYTHIHNAIESTSAFSAKGTRGPSIDFLAGDFTVYKPTQQLSWRLESSARRIDGMLILKHIHTFTRSGDGAQNMRNKEPLLCAKDVLDLPVRLCPHQSSSTDLPVPSRYLKRNNANGPLLTHAITIAFPKALSKDVDACIFRPPTKLEAEQMADARGAVNANENLVYKCRSCPTKYTVEYSTERKRGGELVITSWHCFGRDLLHAARYWKWFVRREGPFLGADKRNDEWWSQGRSVPDFQCE